MVSQEKLRETIDAHLAELLADAIYIRILKDLDEQWNKIASELATSRKTTEQLKETIARLRQNQTDLMSIIEEYIATVKQMQENNKKAAEILKTASE